MDKRIVLTIVALAAASLVSAQVGGATASFRIRVSKNPRTLA